MAVNAVSSHIRISGLASGLDTDSMVTQLMKAERVPLDKLVQNKQLLTWKRDDYRAITTKLNDFNKNFMDVANPSTNMRSQSQYKKFLSSVTDSSGITSGAVTASGTVDASVGSHIIIVKSLATSAKEASTSSISAPLQTGNIKGSLALTDKSVNITLDGITKNITFNSDVTINDQATGDAFAAQLQTQITNAFGKGINDGSKVLVSYDDTTGKLTFNSSAGSNKITFSAQTDTTKDGIGALGLSDKASNRINTSLTLADLASTLNGGLTFYHDTDDDKDKIKFTINKKEFTFTSDTRLSSVISTINNDSTANVNFSYDTVTDKFTLTAKQTGAGQNISITNTWGTFFGATSATAIDPQAVNFGTSGTDAVVKLDNQDITRSSNTFTEGGVTYTLNKADPLQENTVNLSVDVDGIYNNINNYIKSYNDILNTIYTKLNEKYNKDYAPLTDDQRSSMEQADIDKWEEKAKVGLLRSDPTLQKIVSDMRMQLIEPVPGVNVTLASIGVESKSYLDYGKLTVDETKLKDAIKNDPDSVMDLFTQQSTTLSTYDRKATSEQMKARMKEEGLINRLYDIVQNNVSIVMDSGKKKGYLLEKAGMIGDSTDASSNLSKQINDDIVDISDMESKLSDKEESYYQKFSAMEAAMKKLNSQSSWISQQLSSI